MKTKLILLFTFVLFTFNLSAQQSEDSVKVKYKLNKVSIEVHSLEELNDIDWEEVIKVFEKKNVKDNNIEIDLIFKPEKKESSDVNIQNLSFTVQGDSEGKDEMIQDMSRFVTFLKELFGDDSGK
jgi:GLPGLI family protein